MNVRIVIASRELVSWTSITTSVHACQWPGKPIVGTNALGWGCPSDIRRSSIKNGLKSRLYERGVSHTPTLIHTARDAQAYIQPEGLLPEGCLVYRGCAGARAESTPSMGYPSRPMAIE